MGTAIPPSGLHNVGFYYRGGLRAVCFTALARLRDGLSEPFPDSPGTRIIDIAFPLNDAFDPRAGAASSRSGHSSTGNGAMATRKMAARWGQ